MDNPANQSSSPPSRTTCWAAVQQDAIEDLDGADEHVYGNSLVPLRRMPPDWFRSIALADSEHTVSVVPGTHSLARRHEIEHTRRRLGLIGDIAFADAATGTAAPLTLVPTAARVGTPTFPLGAQTRRVDAEGRLKPGLDAGSLSDLLGWSPGGLEVTVVEGWLLLHQSDESLNAPPRRCGALARFNVEANGAERIALRPAHLDRASLPADRYLLLAPLPDVNALVAVSAAACLAAAPAHITAALCGASERKPHD